MAFDEKILENKFIEALRHHLKGWREKVTNDFSMKSFNAELKSLKSDPVYTKFHLDNAGYVNIRFMGRMSISIGRRLGEIYDRVPRFLAASRYSIPPEHIAEKFGGLELDIGLRFSQISKEDAKFVRDVCEKHTTLVPNQNGVGIEIRYNFNPNDSSRLRKDEDMARKLKQEKLLPIYLVFSSISPRDEAIERLKRAGWCFIIGQKGLDFATELLGMDISSILDRPAVSREVKKEIDEMMSDIKNSYALKMF